MSETTYTQAKPVDSDLMHDDLEFNPALEPKEAKAWLNLLQEAEDAFEPWNSHCDNIERQYASLERLAQMNRDKEFSMFWANCEVIKPSIYAKPPQPVVVPKFKDRRPVYQAASEIAERCAIVAFDLADIDELMRLVRDDLALLDRGVAWCRYESGKQGYYSHEKVCIDFKNRRDFLHSISRNWREVTWVAAASYLTRAQARERFKERSGDEYQRAEYKVDQDSKEVGGADNRERAKFWEVWDKGSRRVVWVSQGCELILDEDEPHLDLRGYYPCPKPAYGTVQRGSLVPVPDVLQYRDQLEEINLLTGRIHALSDALEVKGFYPAGGAELSDAIQAAVATKTSGRMLVPISNWAAFGGSKEVIIWLPIDQIATTIQALVLLRKQIIEDIYQIVGLADIMRGDTEPNETLGAQQMKSQYGSTRIRDKQQELVRLARDLVEITLEIVTGKFKGSTIVEMSQTQLPTQKMVEKKINEIIQDVQQQYRQLQQQTQLAPPPQPGAEQQDPNQQLQQQFEQIKQQAQQTLQKLQSDPTIDQVLHFLKDSRAKAFTLDIETDSTILQDEQQEKQSRTEFLQVLSNLIPQLSTMIQTEPKTAEFCGEILKFATAPFRAGRTLDGAIDDLVQQMKERADQPRPDDPVTAKGKLDMQVEQMKQQTAEKKNQQDMQIKMLELQQKDQHKQLEIQSNERMKQIEMQNKGQDSAVKMQVQGQKLQENREAHEAHMAENQQKMDIDRQKAGMAMQAQAHKAADMQARQGERQQQMKFKQDQAQMKQPGLQTP